MTTDGARGCVTEDMERARTSFEDFVRACGPGLHRAAWVLTRDVGHAEDPVQSALLSTWKAWHRIETEPGAYARTVLVREFVSTRRRRMWGERPGADQDVAGSSAKTDAPEENWVDRVALHDALLALPRAQRAVVVLRFLEDVSVDATAQALGIGTGTVKSHTSRALAHLRVDPAVEGSTR